MGKTKMSSKAARRIQSHSDKTGKNQNFKSRAQKAAAKNESKKWNNYIDSHQKLNNFFFSLFWKTSVNLIIFSMANLINSSSFILISKIKR